MSAEISSPKTSVQELVNQLGADAFQTRQFAARELLRLGPVAERGLEHALADSDAEVRERAGSLLHDLRQTELEHALQIFANGKQLNSQTSLPAIKAIANILGPVDQSRHLVVDIVRAEPRLLRMLDEKSPDLPRAFADRVTEVESSILAGSFDEERPPVRESMAALMVVGLSLPNPPGGAEIQSISRRLGPEVLGTNHRRDPTWPAMARLLGAWVRQDVSPELRDLHFQLGLVHRLPITLDMARQVLSEPQTTTNNAVWALRATLRFGSEKDLGSIQALFRDERPILRNSNKVQVRDLALVAALHLSHQDATEYGLASFRLHPLWGFDLARSEQYTFGNEEERKQAFAKYAVWKKQSAR
jgi:hypothetical protein